jgi:hypothetical protein
MAWKEIMKWLGISVAFVKGGYDHYLMFKGLISGGTKIKERLGILVRSTGLFPSHTIPPSKIQCQPPKV